MRSSTWPKTCDRFSQNLSLPSRALRLAAQKKKLIQWFGRCLQLRLKFQLLFSIDLVASTDALLLTASERPTLKCGFFQTIFLWPPPQPVRAAIAKPDPCHGGGAIARSGA